MYLKKLIMCPHFGFMDENRMSRPDALLLRTKLHWRCGVRRVRENEVSSGLATLYDALLSAMRWYILTRLHTELGDDAEEQLENERFVFALLRKTGVLDRSLDVRFLEEIVDKALMGEDVSVYQERVMAELQQFLTRLGVIPFAEEELPPEDQAVP